MEEERPLRLWWEAATPREWLDRLGRAVTVQLRGGSAAGAKGSIEGYLHAIDPELHHLMILRPLPPPASSSNAPVVRVERVVAFAHAIASVTFGSDRAPMALDGDVTRLFAPAPATENHDTLAARPGVTAASETFQHRKAVVQQLLEKALIPHAEEAGGVIVVMGGVASIDPPYNAASCRSRNEIVLQRLQAILATLVPA